MYAGAVMVDLSDVFVSKRTWTMENALSMAVGVGCFVAIFALLIRTAKKELSSFNDFTRV